MIKAAVEAGGLFVPVKLMARLSSVWVVEVRMLMGQLAEMGCQRRAGTNPACINDKFPLPDVPTMARNRSLVAVKISRRSSSLSVGLPGTGG